MANESRCRTAEVLRVFDPLAPDIRAVRFCDRAGAFRRTLDLSAFNAGDLLGQIHQS